MAVDIEGNCRFYDLLRFRKMAKISSQPARMDDVKMGPASFRLLLNSCMGLSQEAFVSIVHSNDIAIESVEVRTENEKALLGSG